MPFSIKRFTMHRSSSLPGGGNRPPEPAPKPGGKISITEVRKTSKQPKVNNVQQHQHQHQHQHQQQEQSPLQSSRSMDPQELRRLGFGRPPELLADALASAAANHTLQAIQEHPVGPLSGSATLPGRLRGAGGRPQAKKNGVRFQENDWEDKSGGRGAPPLRPSSALCKRNDWDSGHMSDSGGSMRRLPPSTARGGRFEPPSRNDLQGRLSVPSSVFEDDPGIMSEAETAATGFRRASRVRSSLPIVRTPSKTQERPLGLVFLQYQNETKRALLPNEITSMDTVRALFVRSFPRQLDMQYLDSPMVRVYIHDPAKDMFYELEDLRDIRDRSVLRIYEQPPDGVANPAMADPDLSYFSEPEFESEYAQQHVHRGKVTKPVTAGGGGYYGTLPAHYGTRAQTLPHNATMRNYSPNHQTAPPKPQRSFQQSLSPLPPPAQPPPGIPSPRTLVSPDRSNSSIYGGCRESGYLSSPERHSRTSGYGPQFETDSLYGGSIYGSRSVTPLLDEDNSFHRMRMEYMERQLASLTGLVQKALTTPTPNQQKPPLTAKIQLNADVVNQLRYLSRQTKDIRLEVRNLRRMAQAHQVTARDTLRDTCLKIKSLLSRESEGVCAERLRVTREEDLYKIDVTRLETDLTELEGRVEELRGNVINRKCRVVMSDVETMAHVLSRASKTVADLKARFPNLQDSLKSVMAHEMEVVVREEKFLKDEPDRLEHALRRCKKLTGTLVTLKRLASVQEQRHTTQPDMPSVGEQPNERVENQPPQRGGENALDTLLDELQAFTKPLEAGQERDPIPGLLGPPRRLPSYPSAESPVRQPAPAANSAFRPPAGKPPEGDMIARVSVGGGGGVPKKAPPPPPPRTTSRSPMTSPVEGEPPPLRTSALEGAEVASNSSSSESVNSQEGGSQLQLKKTGSESNLLARARLTPAGNTGSLTHLASAAQKAAVKGPQVPAKPQRNKIYETDIL